MSATFLRWGVPAFLTVVVGTAAAVLGSSAGIPPDLESRAERALVAARLDWAVVRFTGRDAELSGRAPDRVSLATALRLVAEVQGVRTVTPAVTLTDATQGFLFRAEFDGSGLRLSGAVAEAADITALARAVGLPVTSTANPDSTAPEDFLVRAERVVRALAGLEKGTAVLRGDTVVLSGIARNDADLAALRRDLADLKATIEVTVAPTPAAAGPATAPATTPALPAMKTLPLAAPYMFEAEKQAGGRVILRGVLPDRALLTLFQTKAGSSVVNEASLAAGAPEGFDENARAGLEALKRLVSGRLGYSGGTWQLSGTAPDAALAAALGKDLPGFRLTVAAPEIVPAVPAPPAAAVVAEPAPPAAAPRPVALAEPAPDAAELVEAARAACGTALADLSAQNGIVFAAGSAVLLPESAAEIGALVTALTACPEAAVYIEGHTDADGDAALNLDLSVARAEAVIGALVEKGVAPERLYAVGYGETQPVASNDTKAGKQANRRIAFSLVEPEEPAR